MFIRERLDNVLSCLTYNQLEMKVQAKDDEVSGGLFRKNWHKENNCLFISNRSLKYARNYFNFGLLLPCLIMLVTLRN